MNYSHRQGYRGVGGWAKGTKNFTQRFFKNAPERHSKLELGRVSADLRWFRGQNGGKFLLRGN